MTDLPVHLCSLLPQSIYCWLFYCYCCCCCSCIQFTVVNGLSNTCKEQCGRGRYMVKCNYVAFSSATYNPVYGFLYLLTLSSSSSVCFPFIILRFFISHFIIFFDFLLFIPIVFYTQLYCFMFLFLYVLSFTIFIFSFQFYFVNVFILLFLHFSSNSFFLMPLFRFVFWI